MQIFPQNVRLLKYIINNFACSTSLRGIYKTKIWSPCEMRIYCQVGNISERVIRWLSHLPIRAEHIWRRRQDNNTKLFDAYFESECAGVAFTTLVTRNAAELLRVSISVNRRLASTGPAQRANHAIYRHFSTFQITKCFNNDACQWLITVIDTS